jgi:acid phosphatase (class A)
LLIFRELRLNQTIAMTSNKYLTAFVLPVILVAVSTFVWAQDRYLPPSKPDPIALLPAPPAADSAEQAADLEEVESVVAHRTPQDVARGKEESEFSLATFSTPAGINLQSNKLPKTTAMFQEVLAETKAVTDVGKKYWKRLRPYELDPKLLDGEKESSFGYPSGHSTRATVYALLLAELLSDKREAILAEGRQVGWDRVMLGRHYETDVYAGRVLGQAIVRALHENPKFELDFAAVRAELDAAAAHDGAKTELQEARK